MCNTVIIVQCCCIGPTCITLELESTFTIPTQHGIVLQNRYLGIDDHCQMSVCHEHHYR